MTNPVLKWALQILQNPKETSTNESVAQALKLVGVNPDQIQVNQQPLESVFSAIGEEASIVEKNIPWQPLDVQQVIYPTEHADAAQLNIPEPPGGWDRFHADENLALTLIEKYGTFLSISPQVPYISFYDVVKSAAAIHDCLENGQADEPFLLVSGDFSGIQDVIYTISSSGALKTLRARSFMLELLAEHITYEIQEITGSSRHSLIFSGGGGFSLLVPNTSENQNAIDAFVQIVNGWILEQFGFQLFLALHCEPLNVSAVENNQFKDTWELMADKLGKQKQRKFWQHSDFEGLFHPKMPKQLSNQAACRITHRDDLPAEEMKNLPEVGKVSKLAYRLWWLGDLLTEFNCIVRTASVTDNLEDGTLVFPTHQSQPNSYQYAEYRACSFSDVSDYDARWLVNSWELANYDEKTLPLLYGNYVRSVADLPDEAQKSDKEKYYQDHKKEMDNPEGTTASFSALAKSSQGSSLIGCLRMDVDDSGNFFSQGGWNLGLGIAVSSNLSRSMNLFFKGYLNEICGRNLGTLGKQDYPLNISESSKTGGRNVSIVYAGGDDLFIVGAWDDVAELAFDINVCFRAFSCWNSDVHLSGGVTLHKPKFPLYQMAKMAKQAEDAAKTNEHSETGKKKNSLSLFYSDNLKTLNRSLNKRIDDQNQEHPTWGQNRDRIAIASQWDEYSYVIQLTKRLHQVYSKLPHGFYQKLFETLKIWQEDGVLYMPMMAHASHQLDRIQPQTPELAEIKTFLFQQEHIQKLHISLHWVEYLNRQIGGED